MIKNWTKFKPKIKQVIAFALCIAMLTPTVTQALHFDESRYSMIFIRKGWEPEIENLGEQKELHILKKYLKSIEFAYKIFDADWNHAIIP